MTTADIRTELAQLMDATVRNAANWHYSEFRPCGATITLQDAETGTVWADCSAGYSIICRLAGAPNPLHDGAFDGYGNSVTAYQHLEHITLAEAQIGDGVAYGVGGDHHIAVVREPGPDPLLWSNGGESAPEYVRYSTEQGWQPTPATWLRLMPPDPKPPVVAKTDVYWTWLRWYLGEGEFKDHKRDPDLRPAGIPTKIPATWWAREKKFVAARKARKP